MAATLFLRMLSIWCLIASIIARTLPAPIDKSITQRDELPGLVTWDKYSLSIRGERMFIFSGEFHPWRIPSPGLWLDIFQKIKAMGFNAVSFYTYWGLVEGTPGQVRFDGVFALEEFFKAAAEAGIYLIARPGPYINAETALGGFPGWTARIKAPLRGDDSEFVDATEKYATAVGKLISDAQISKGGPVVMLQPENEYDTWPGINNSHFPAQLNRNYMEHVKQQFRDVGVVVPQMVNDHLFQGNWAPGTGLGETDLYGIDAYPMRYDCAHPDVWPKIRWPEGWQTKHEQYSPNTPFFVAEFQGGSGTGWGTVSQDGCNALVNHESVRVLWKNNYSFAIKIFNIYMTYGGTNWGNLGYRGGDTSYDYGAAIKENRHIWREKYSESKLEANFFKVSPAYLTVIAGNASNGSYVSTNLIATTPIYGTDSPTNFYVIRHADWTSTDTTAYQFNISTSAGHVFIPQLGGELTLSRRDSKIHVTDYDVANITLIYNTAEIFTWAQDNNGKRTLILYGGEGELHEAAINFSKLGYVPDCTSSDHQGKKHNFGNGTYVFQWTVARQRQVLRFGQDLEIFLLWRNEAYNYWHVELPAGSPIGNYSSSSKSAVIVNGGYLIRSAAISDQALSLTGDINATTDLEIIHEPTGSIKKLFFNGAELDAKLVNNKISARVHFDAPNLVLPEFASLEWRYLDSLPEVGLSYDDSEWTTCDQTSTNNPQSLLTPTSLYASDYGYHSGSLIYRGHFIATGNESSLYINVTGGSGFGYSVWMNNQFLSAWDGGGVGQGNSTYGSTIPLGAQSITRGSENVITLLIDHMGQDEEAPGTDAIKSPMGLINYSLSGHAQDEIMWKLTGNLGGENYHDLARGPRNEGAMFAERQGYHQASPPSAEWAVSSPFVDGITGAGVGFYTTTFELDVPDGYDVPLSFVFSNTTTSSYRVQLFVNGWQFAKYVANLGPQTNFPVPEGILNHNGINTLSMTLWSVDDRGAKLDTLSLEAEMPLWSGYRKPWLVDSPSWTQRSGAY